VARGKKKAQRYHWGEKRKLRATGPGHGFGGKEGKGKTVGEKIGKRTEYTIVAKKSWGKSEVGESTGRRRKGKNKFLPRELLKKIDWLGKTNVGGRCASAGKRYDGQKVKISAIRSSWNRKARGGEGGGKAGGAAV